MLSSPFLSHGDEAKFLHQLNPNSVSLALTADYPRVHRAYAPWMLMALFAGRRIGTHEIIGIVDVAGSIVFCRRREGA